jgi:hypothetical protein
MRAGDSTRRTGSPWIWADQVVVSWTPLRLGNWKLTHTQQPVGSLKLPLSGPGSALDDPEDDEEQHREHDGGLDEDRAALIALRPAKHAYLRLSAPRPLVPHAVLGTQRPKT